MIAVEGYVDVISMTKAGFPETVAPLGTALTADQCALLWTMAEEPILCFDGDKAGRKAAFRALETALPLIGPGKSLQLRAAARGPGPRRPRPLRRRRGGRRGDRAARPFAEMLFQRETEGQAFDTPEKRAGLERRLRELSAAVGDETLRRHYAADLAQRRARPVRLRRPAPPGRHDGAARPQRRPRARRRFDPGPRPASPSQPMPRPGFGRRAGREPPREIVILAALIGHPALIDRVFEEIATLEFASRALAEFRGRLLDVAPRRSSSAEALAAALTEAGTAAS